MPAKKGGGSLTGAQKSAVLCMALGPELASRILQRLSPEEMERVGREIAALASVKGEVVEAVMKEFQDVSTGRPSSVRGGVSVAQQLLVDTVGVTEAQGLIGRIRGSQDTGELKRLQRAAPDVLGSVLLGEHPQTIALVLGQLGPRQASAVLRSLEPAIAGEVLYRMGRLEQVSPEVIGLVQAALRDKGEIPIADEAPTAGGADLVAQVMKELGDREADLMEALSERDAELAARIKARMFTFEDLVGLDSRAVQNVLRQIETKDLALALKGASAELKKHLQSGLSERAREALDEEIEMLGPVRVKDVEEVQAKILETVRGMGESGEIVLPSRGGGDDVIS